MANLLASTCTESFTLTTCIQSKNLIDLKWSFVCQCDSLRLIPASCKSVFIIEMAMISKPVCLRVIAVGPSCIVIVWRQDRLSPGDLCSGLMIESGCPEVKLQSHMNLQLKLIRPFLLQSTFPQVLLCFFVKSHMMSHIYVLSIGVWIVLFYQLALNQEVALLKQILMY